jgi:hypothetical protein
MGDGADVLFSLPSNDDDGGGDNDNVVDIFIIKAFRAYFYLLFVDRLF